MIQLSNKAFVFVVCGQKQHTDALHYSLQALNKFSNVETIVLTDSSRNEATIKYGTVIDVKTPEGLTHHQASIFLKTSVHEHLPSGKQYCYLDTDVIALDSKVDQIFNEFIPPILFAKDHCLMDRFSPSAITCACKKQFDEWQNELKSLFLRYKDLSREPENVEKKELLLAKFDALKEDKIRNAFISLRFWMARKKFQLDEDTFYDKRNFVWHDKDLHPIIFEKDVVSAIESIESTTAYSNDRLNSRVWTRNGKNVFDCRCNHLLEQIEKTFAIRITNPEWQHWNGGVFLFNNQSHDFLNAWHEKTLHTFNLPEWKTRDQGTLIATAWEFGLENHSTLDSRFNLIADYEHRHLQHLGDLNFKFENQDQIIVPILIHIYHHWGDKNWDVWLAIEKKTGVELEED